MAAEIDDKLPPHSSYMLMRVVAVTLLLSAGIAAEAMSYSFVSKASGRLGGPIRFEFYSDSTTRPKTDIASFTVSMRTADDKWKAMWSILSGHGLTQPIEYGVTPPGFTTMIKPQKLIPGRVYAGFATDGHGGSSGVTFGFGKNGRMVFPDSVDE
ncbi:MAG TPA: hypothetical protein VK562_01820 [Candidatus Acidoferrum sp.]|jgi:hypothetical protein|nr:hypothetical protein [Candidatus Acidoferrum sp.]